MTNDFSNLRAPSRADALRRRSGDGPGLYIVFGAAVLVAAIVGGLVVFFALRSSQPQVATPSAPAAAQTGNAGGQPATPQVRWKDGGNFGSWQVQCQEANAKICRAILQVIRDKQVIMAWLVGADGKGVMQNVLQTPTGVLVSAGVDIKVASAPARHANYAACGPQACSASFPLDDAFIKEASAAAEGTHVVMYAANGQSVDFGIPTTGLDKAVAALKK
jgi:invasion protein IalB